MHHDIKLLKKNWKPSTKKKPKESLYERVRAGMNTGKKHEVFSKSGEKKSRKEISGVIKTDRFVYLRSRNAFFETSIRVKTMIQKCHKKSQRS